MEKMTAENVRVEIAVSDANGVYCPSVFLERYENALCCAGSKDEICTDERISEAVEFVKNRENLMEDGYWDDWEYVMANVKVFSEAHNGMDAEYWSINQNGDVWLLNDADYNQLDDEEQEKFWENRCD